MTRRLMHGCEVFGLSRGVYGVSYQGRDLGVARHNVVADGAIKWSAYDNLGQRLTRSYLTLEDAVRAIASTR